MLENGAFLRVMCYSTTVILTTLGMTGRDGGKNEKVIWCSL
nr:MAG TPA: hypothetical protein [Caudoviricetes sp.]DAR31329.1 MAG TPA: hypothetical protein [Caudoviricetes sp.]